MVIDLRLLKILAFLLLLCVLSFLLTFTDASYDFVKFGLLVVTVLMAFLLFFTVRIISRK